MNLMNQIFIYDSTYLMYFFLLSSNDTNETNFYLVNLVNLVIINNSCHSCHSMTLYSYSAIKSSRYSSASGHNS